MDDTDRSILNVLQTDFPIVRDPFAAIGARLVVSEEEAIGRVRQLKDQQIIRQISAVFDSAALGYKSLLVAFSVPTDRIDEVAAIVSEHPGVSHNYERNHFYNLWFTITVPPEDSAQEEVEQLTAIANPQKVRLFPTTKMFKIGVAFDMKGTGANLISDVGRVHTAGRENVRRLDDRDILAVRALQRDLPLTHRPFAVLAESLGVEEDELISKALAFLETGVMRRYAAVLRHREAGFAANAMTVWAVPEDRTDEVGAIMAGHRAVSHCYQRPTYPDWSYSLFSMIHGRTPADCKKAVDEISRTADIADYKLLFSTREFKKSRVQYYE